MTGNRPEVGALQAQIVAVAIITSTVIYAVIVLLLQTTGSMPKEGIGGLEPDLLQMLSIALLVAGTCVAAASFFVRGALVAKLTDETDCLAARMRIIKVSLAVSEAASVMGLTLAFLGGLSLYVWLLWGIGLGAGILLFPTRDWLEPTRRE